MIFLESRKENIIYRKNYTCGLLAAACISLVFILKKLHSETYLRFVQHNILLIELFGENYLSRCSITKRKQI